MRATIKLIKACFVFISWLFLIASSDKSDNKVSGNLKDKLTVSDKKEYEPKVVEGLITSGSVNKAFVGMEIKDLLKTYKINFFVCYNCKISSL